MRKLGYYGDVMHIRRGDFIRLGQAGVLVYTDKHLQTEIPLVPHLSLIQLWVRITVLIFGGTGRRDHNGMNDRDLLHGHSDLPEMRLASFKII